MTQEFKINKHELVYDGFFKLELYHLQHTLYQGGWSQELSRELFRRGSCVAVLLYDPDRDKVILIEQFRTGAILNPDRAWLIEIVAGAIEPGETAESVAYRESKEEAGCEIDQMILINEFYTTPGGASERISLFCGKVDSQGIGGIHGLEHEGEDIKVSSVSFKRAYEMVENGEIESAIPIIALQWLYIHKQTLRQQWK